MRYFFVDLFNCFFTFAKFRWKRKFKYQKNFDKSFSFLKSAKDKFVEISTDRNFPDLPLADLKKEKNINSFNN